MPNEACSDPLWVWVKLSEVKGVPQTLLCEEHGPRLLKLQLEGLCQQEDDMALSLGRAQSKRKQKILFLIDWDESRWLDANH